MKAIIVGAGIGGLTTAIALQRLGWEVQVCERTRELTEVGAGIALAPNAVVALDQLGVGADVRQVGFRPDTAEFRTPDGSVLISQSLRRLEARFGAPTVVIHRGDLQRLLADAAGREVISLGMRCTGFDQDGSGAAALFEGGSRVRGDVVVGADGARSAIGAQLHGVPLRYAGYKAFRAVCDSSAGADQAKSFLVWGRGEQFVAAGLGPDRVYWGGGLSLPEGSPDPIEGWKARLMAIFGRWRYPIPTLIDATPESAISSLDVYDREPLSTWIAERVCLLGDAAHAMTPDAAQGACQAILDAVVLADSFAATSSPIGALEAYDRRRRPRANRVVGLSRRLTAIGQTQRPWICQIRNLVAPMVPAWFMDRQASDLLRGP